MPKKNHRFVCQDCGNETPRWSGRCDTCGNWNSIIEEEIVVSGAVGGGLAKPKSNKKMQLLSLKGAEKAPPRLLSGLSEFDRVLGGGLVPGSVIIVGGDPGIGKSTILLQALAGLAVNDNKVIYISGEEAADQVRMRAERLGLSDSSIDLAIETNLGNILNTLETGNSPHALVIDSIQTIWTPNIEATPGTVSQVRAVTQSLISYAKTHGTAVIIVGHVTKNGQIAGPKVIEHMVDTVLYFEGEGGHQFRILRAVKNRFGPTDEIGVFTMADSGLQQVTDPSNIFIAERSSTTPGSAIYAGIEGTRPLLVEIQALVAPSSLGTPRRAVVGWDGNRLAMILAVLDAYCGLSFANHDVYLNIAGGLRVKEPAADLAVAIALVSSLSQNIIPVESIFFGEVSLSGAVRPVSRSAARIKEAKKLGFGTAIIPKGTKDTDDRGMKLVNVSDLAELIAWSATSVANN